MIIVPILHEGTLRQERFSTDLHSQSVASRIRTQESESWLKPLRLGKWAYIFLYFYISPHVLRSGLYPLLQNDNPFTYFKF